MTNSWQIISTRVLQFRQHFRYLLSIRHPLEARSFKLKQLYVKWLDLYEREAEPVWTETRIQIT